MFSETQLLTLPAFLPSVISFYFPEIGNRRGGGGGRPSLAPPLHPPLVIFGQKQTLSKTLQILLEQ